MVELLAAIASIAVNFIPGVLLSFALLKHTSFSRLDKALFGAILSTLAVPMLLFLEFLFLGIKFSTMLVIANALLVIAIAVFLLHYQKHEFKPPSFGRFDLKDFLSKHSFSLILIAILACSFYVRYATSASPVFFEFDPYFYDKITEKIVLNGFIEDFSAESYYPDKLFTRVPPLLHYMQASWYSVYQTAAGGDYSKELLIGTAQLYPPFVAALMSFLAFVLLREEYNEQFGLIAAGLFAFMPQLVSKFAAGVSEQQPFGIFAVMLAFCVYALALNRKSNKLALLSAFSMACVVLASQQFIWPFMVFTVYIALQSVLDYILGTLDSHFVKTNALLVAGGVAGNILLHLFGGPDGRFPLFTTNSIILVASLAFSAGLFALAKFKPSHHYAERIKLLAGLGAIALVIALLTPLMSILVGVVVSQTGVAFAQGALGKTIQEEGTTNPAIFPSAFGFIDPNIVLELAAVAAAVIAILALLRKKHTNYAIIASVLTALVVFLNGPLDTVLTSVANATGSQPLIGFIKFFASSDVFIYLLVGLAATSVYYLLSQKKSRIMLLFVLVFFPVAFIGLNKVKYLLHLSIAVALAAVYVLGESHKIVQLLGDLFNFASKEKIAGYAMILLVVLGVGAVGLEAQTAEGTMKSLAFNRIPSDWVQISELDPSFKGTPTSGMGWLYHNANRFEASDRQACVAKFGWDCRVLSWWDYGHWTTFFGDSNTVLDPNNNYPHYDQEVARSFVNGNPSDLEYSMDFHHATHILVDSDLIAKWGALVFLSGTCQNQNSPICPQTPEIDWTKGAGSSQYEAEHYYEYLTLTDQQCPQSASAVPLPLLQSSFGTYYCADNENLYLLTQNGLSPGYSRKFILLQASNMGDPIDHSASYLVPLAQGRFLNINPDLTPLGINSKVIDSAFTRLFFFERLDGYQMVFKAPNGAVRIFERVSGGITPALASNSTNSTGG